MTPDGSRGTTDTTGGDALVPLVLLDVDGVLNAVTPQGDPAIWPDWQYGQARAGGRRWPIAWSPTVTGTIRRWHAAGLADVRWLTTWRTEANRELRRLLELPELPVVDGNHEVPVAVPTADGGATTHAEFAGADAASLLTGRWWKFDLVLDLVRAAPARPFVWLDDDLASEGRVQEWLAAHTTSLALAPRPDRGLTADLLRTAEQWLVDHHPEPPVPRDGR
jgi:hypothetical protein